MADFEPHLVRWQSAGLLDKEQTERIRAYESGRKGPAGMQWQVLVALIFGAILLAAGVVLFVNAHWDEMSPMWRFVLVMAMVSGFHVGGAMARANFRGLSTTLHAVGTVATGAAIALVGQIFNMQEHWPAAVMLWAMAAAAGWVLLRDEAQQTLTLLLTPAWLLCEWSDAAHHYQGGDAYLARMLCVWAALYLTYWHGSRKAAVWGVCFTASAIALIVSSVMLLDGYEWLYNAGPFLPWKLRLAGWLLIVALPLLFAVTRWRRTLLPVAAALITAIALPFCQTQVSYTYWNWNGQTQATYSHSTPNIFAYVLLSAFAAVLAWWGVRQASKPLVNYGIVAFACSIVWFFFADIFDKVGRSTGMIVLGVLFLAGGWALERMRRRLIASISKRSGADLSPVEAQ
jgi:uncharacterized membrane protein